MNILPFESASYAEPLNQDELSAMQDIITIAERLKPHASGRYLTGEARWKVKELISDMQVASFKAMREVR